MIVPVNVFMIRLSHNPISMWYAGRTYQSWVQAGYKVNLVEGVTPETIENELQYVGFRFDDLKRGGMRKRPFTTTEHAIFYSHAKALRLAKSNNKPSIILEHDAILRGEPIENFGITKFDMCPLRDGWPAVAYYITPKAAKAFLEHLVSQKIKVNYDWYLWNQMLINNREEDFKPYNRYVHHEQDISLGTTIDHDGDNPWEQTQ